MSIQPEIIKAFHLTEQDADVVRELESTCNIYSLTPDKLRMKWEAFALSSQCDLKPSVNFIRILKNSLQREFERGLKSRRTVKGKITTKRTQDIDFSEYGIGSEGNMQEDSVDSFMSNMFGTQPIKQERIAATPRLTKDTQLSETSNLFSHRNATHLIDMQYNSNLPLPIKEDSHEFSFTFTREPIQPYRYMFEKIKDISDNLDERIDYIGSLIQEAHHIDYFVNPMRVCQEAIYAYGLVCSDTSEVRLNEKSIVLQTSKDLGMGGRILLDMSRVNSYTLFPGQVIGIKGINHNGRCFHVDEILMPPTPEKPAIQIKENKSIDMIVASGPFTLSEDLAFKPLEELLEMCSQQKPNVILLLGPFLSIHHPKINSGHLTTFPESIVQEQVIKRLEYLLETTCKETNVFLMPHANDIIHTYNLFPQPKFENLIIKHPRIHLTSNPSSLSINGFKLAIANVDILFRLGMEEISKNPEQTDRFSRLVDHIFQQHTFYPLFPVALDDNVDSERMVDLHLATLPDILIIPSQFKHFVKNVRNSICINPGFLCKNQTGGTYARVIMYPNADERIRVDLIKL